MTTTESKNDNFLDDDDHDAIHAITNSRLPDADKESIIDSIRAEAWRLHTASTVNVAIREPFSVDSLRTKPTKPDGWDEAKARVKAQLEKNRMDAPIEGSRNDPFYAATMREEAEQQRVQAMKQRSEQKIHVMRENRIKTELGRYDQAKTAADKRAVLESLSPEALARLANDGASKS